MKKKIISILLMVISLLSVNKIMVKANSYDDYLLTPFDTVPNVYVTKLGTINTYDYLHIMKRASDGQFVYCIQPGVKINKSALYTGNITNQLDASKLTFTEWQRIQLLAYYGYGYSENGIDHSDIKWYAVTQFLIWKTAPLGQDIFFTDYVHGNRIEKYAEEQAELNRLVDEHTKRSSFDNSYTDMIIGDTITLNDTNGVLNNYEVISTSSNVNVSKNGNQLTINALNTGNIKITLSKKCNRYGVPSIVYVADNTQRFFSRGNVDPIEINLGGNILGGKVIGNKVDDDSKNNIPQGDATLEGAKYNLLDENKNYITTFTTNDNGYFESNNILKPNTIYYLKEVSPSRGYNLDTNEYKFSITTSNLEVNIKLYEKVIKRKIEIFKVFASSSTKILAPEPNVTFEVYNKATGSYYGNLTTNNNGYANITLPYGTWTFKQKTVTPNYEKVKDFDIYVGEQSNEAITKIISNAEITSKIRLIKVDSNSKKIIEKDGIKFKIKNLSTGDYVCQNITYPSQTKICTFETKNGYFTTPYALSLGNYQIEELEDQLIEGYTWNSKPLRFSIDQNSKFIYDNEFGIIHEIMFENQQVKGEVNLTKFGQSYRIVNGKLKYEEILLNNVKYSLYANDDIVSADGTLVYKKDTKITSFKTVDGKYKLTNLYLGKYKLIEEETDENHILSTKPIYFEIKYKDQYTDNIVINLIEKNYLKKGSLEIKKIDYKTNNALKNIVFELHMEKENKDIVAGTCATDINGKIIIKDIPIIKDYKYYVKEIKTIEGYLSNNKKIYVDLKQNEIATKTITNTKISSIIRIYKRDSEGNFIPNVKIAIYKSNNELVDNFITNEYGFIEVNLEYGDYYYKEVETIEGLILNEEKVNFSITENNKDLEFTLINEIEKVNVPITLKNNNPYRIIIILTLIIIGIGLMIYANRNK